MTTYRRDIEDANGDLVDLELYCSAICWTVAAFTRGDMETDATGHAWPCPEATDYAQLCACCGVLIVQGMSEEA